MSALYLFFFFTDSAPTEIYTLSLHDALPILVGRGAVFLLRVLGGAAVLFFVVLLAFLLFLFRRHKLDRIERLAEITRSDGPGNGLAAVRPAKIIGANVGDALHRHGRRQDIYGRRFASRGRQGHQVKLVHDVRQGVLAIRARLDIIGRNRLLEEVHALPLYHQVRAAIRAVVTKRNESLWRVNVTAVFFIREMRPARAACGQDELGVAALGGNPHEVGVAGLPAIEAAVLAVVGVAAQQHDARAV